MMVAMCVIDGQNLMVLLFGIDYNSICIIECGENVSHQLPIVQYDNNIIAKSQLYISVQIYITKKKFEVFIILE